MHIVHALQNNDVARRVVAAAQEHVFTFWEEFDEEQRKGLWEQIEGIDLELLKFLKKKYIDKAEERFFKGSIEPVDVIRVPQTKAQKQAETEAKVAGDSLLRSGKVAVLLVAGGLGTRLGYDAPKGTYEISPMTRRSLFQCHAEKIQALCKKYHTAIPWYIMTSSVTYDPTVAFFEHHDYFGLPGESVFFFNQGTFPALDEAGKLFLDAKDHIITNPDGHGGTLRALAKSGAIADMRRRGIEEIFYFQVDNVLIKICDPIFLGYHVQRSAEMSAKVTPKRSPDEGLGVIGRINGRVGVIEYSDLTTEDKEARTPDGQLKYRDGSIAIHILSVDFVQRLNESTLNLPFHIAHKRIPHINRDGQFINPDSPNGYKFEHFIFDALGEACQVAIMEVVREDEFSPVKNKEGNDSPETARRDLTNLYGRWLEASGVCIPRDSKGNVQGQIEISPLFALDCDELVEKVDSSLTFDGKLLLE